MPLVKFDFAKLYQQKKIVAVQIDVRYFSSTEQIGFHLISYSSGKHFPFLPD